MRPYETVFMRLLVKALKLDVARMVLICQSSRSWASFQQDERCHSLLRCACAVQALEH